MEFCKRYARVAWARPEKTPKRVLFTRLRCKKWSCEYCAKKNAAEWRDFLGRRLPEVSGQWWMLTLTAHSMKRGKIASYENLRKGIDVLMKRMRRVWGKIEYVRVYEKHPTSEALHAHLLISGISRRVVWAVRANGVREFKPAPNDATGKSTWSSLSWLKKAAHGAKIGYQVALEKCRDGYAVFYVSKYLTKSSQSIDIKGLRRVQTSRGIGSVEAGGDLSWMVADFATARDFEAGEIVVDLQTGQQIDVDFWSQFDRYPAEMN